MVLSATSIEAEINLIKYLDEDLEESLLLTGFCGNGIHLNQIWLTNLSQNFRRKNNLTHFAHVKQLESLAKVTWACPSLLSPHPHHLPHPLWM